MLDPESNRGDWLPIELIKPIFSFFSSPGTSNEHVHLFIINVRSAQRDNLFGEPQVKDIELMEFDIKEFFDKLESGEFEDPKLLICGRWLRANSPDLAYEQVDDEIKPPHDVQVEIGNTDTFRYRIKGSSNNIIGIKTGNIANITGVDAWVNSEATDMLMDRYWEQSISATIRSLGARKDRDGRFIMEDTIGKAVSAELGGRNFVRIGTVVQTTAGELSETHGVKRIFHVATVDGMTWVTSLSDIEFCMKNVLAAIAATKRYRSVLVPLLGTGRAGFPAARVIPLLVARAFAFFGENPKSALREIYFSAYAPGDLTTLQSAIECSNAVEYIGNG